MNRTNKTKYTTQMQIISQIKKRGLYIEECKPDEDIPALSLDEYFNHVTKTLNECEWTRVGYETGREFGAVNFKIDVFDSEIINLRRWFIGKEAPPIYQKTNKYHLQAHKRHPKNEHKFYIFRCIQNHKRHQKPIYQKWAVEFFTEPEILYTGEKPQSFRRCYFWFPSKCKVPTKPEAAP